MQNIIVFLDAGLSVRLKNIEVRRPTSFWPKKFEILKKL